MKKILVAVFCLAAAIGYSQIAYKPPTLQNAPYYFDAGPNQLIDLDAAQYFMVLNPKGIADAESVMYINDTTTSVKLNKEGMTFVVNLQPGVDPATLMQLKKATVNYKTKKREFFTYKKGKISESAAKQVIDISFTKMSEGFYVVRPIAPLENGEYFFSLSANEKSKIVYCFTVK